MKRFDPGPDDYVAMRFAVAFDVAPETLEAARKQSHDALIADLGPRRRSGVHWFQYNAPRGLEKLDEIGIIPDDDGLREALRAHPFGCLVIAMAEGDSPS